MKKPHRSSCALTAGFEKALKDLNQLANEALFLIIPPFYPLANKKAAGYLQTKRY